MNYVKFHKATVDAKTGLIGLAIQLNEDQELEDEELREVDEEYKKLVEDGEAMSDFLRGN